MRLKVITSAGVEAVVTVNELLEVDGVKYGHVPEPMTETELAATLRVNLAATSKLADQVEDLTERVNELSDIMNRALEAEPPTGDQSHA